MAEVRKIDLGERSSQGFVGRVSPTMTGYFHSANLQNLEFFRLQASHSFHDSFKSRTNVAVQAFHIVPNDEA